MVSKPSARGFSRSHCCTRSSSSPEVSLPAVGQGALGIEARSDDARVLGVLAALHDLETAVCVAAERGVMAALGGDCKTPLGAHATHVSDEMELGAFVAAPDGSRLRRARERTAWPGSEAHAEAFGREVGGKLLS